MELPIYTEHFIVDFSVAPIATIPTAEGAEDQQVFDTSPFLEPDSQEELPGGQTTEEAEALVGEEGGAFGVGIQTGLSAGAFTELGMGGLVGGAAGGPDEGTGGGFNPSLGTGGSGTGNPGVLGGPLGDGDAGGGITAILGIMKSLGERTSEGNFGSEALQTGFAGSGQQGQSGPQSGTGGGTAGSQFFNQFGTGGSTNY